MQKKKNTVLKVKCGYYEDSQITQYNLLNNIIRLKKSSRILINGLENLHNDALNISPAKQSNLKKSMKQYYFRAIPSEKLQIRKLIQQINVESKEE